MIEDEAEKTLDPLSLRLLRLGTLPRTSLQALDLDWAENYSISSKS